MFFFLSICCFNRFSRFRFGHCYLIHVRSRLGTPPTLSVGEGDLGDRAVWCAIIFELYRCVDHRSFVDTSASPWKTRSRSRRWKKQVFFLILYHDVYVVFFFFRVSFLFKIDPPNRSRRSLPESWSLHAHDRICNCVHC